MDTLDNECEVNYEKTINQEIWEFEVKEEQKYEQEQEEEQVESEEELEEEQELEQQCMDQNEQGAIIQKEQHQMGKRKKGQRLTSRKRITNKAKGKKKLDEEQQNFYNNSSQSGEELIQDIIDIIRHQQYLLDNLDHLNEYNESLLKIWKKQLNLLDFYDRFDYYKSLGRMKELMKQFQLLQGITINNLLKSNQNKEILKDKDTLIQLLIHDLEKIKAESDFHRVKFELQLKSEDYESVRFLNRQSEKYVSQVRGVKREAIEEEEQQLLEENEEQNICLLEYVWQFVLNIMNFFSSEYFKKCYLCNVEVEDRQKLVKHCNESHLKFLSILLLGEKDKCFSMNCYERRKNQERETYNFSNHLKWGHSDIYKEDCIFSKLYNGVERTQKVCDYFYGKDAKHWKQKLEKDLFEWLDRVDPGAKQFLIDSNVMNKRGEILLREVRSWMENDSSLLESEVEGAFGDFDQLSFLLKWSWSNSSIEGVRDLQWINDKINPEPRRILMIEAIADLLNTKQSLLAQLHRYLYLGVFNFKLTQRELNFRLVNLEKLLQDLGVFQSIIFNMESFHNSCLFEDVLCSSSNIKFKAPLDMYKHYYETHIGVIYALSSPYLFENLERRARINGGEQTQGTAEEDKQAWRRRRKMRSIDTHNFFKELRLNEIIHYLHDHHKADVKTLSKRFLRACRENFQIKCICFSCDRELHHFGEVFWKEDIIITPNRKKLKLILKHKQTVREVIQVYQSIEEQGQRSQRQQQFLQNENWSELKIIEEQCQLFKKQILEQMRREVLIDDKGRYSQCKDCYQKLKTFNPLLKELKEEYFTLPFGNDVQYGHGVMEEKELEDSNQLEVKETDPLFIKAQKKVLNRMLEEKGGLGVGGGKKKGRWTRLREEMSNGYFRISSFPKLVEIYGEISEKKDQNPRRVLSQPILTGYMKVLFQTPLIYIANSNIIYEIQPQWNKVKHKFKLFGSSELQRAEFIQILESHPIIQNHTYQLSNLTKLCVDQVDLMFQLNKHLLKQTTKKQRAQEQEQEQVQEEEDKIGLELTKTADLMYFESVLHRAQICFVIQQFRIWIEVFQNVIGVIEQFVYLENFGQVEEIQFEKNTTHKQWILHKLSRELKKIQISTQNQECFSLELLLILGVFYLKGANQFPSFQIKREINERSSSMLDFLLSEHESNPIRFIVESHILPIVIPLIDQFVHPIFIGTLIQIFQLNRRRRMREEAEEKVGEELEIDATIKYYLRIVYAELSYLTIKRCLPLFELDQGNQNPLKKKKEQMKISLVLIKKQANMSDNFSISQVEKEGQKEDQEDESECEEDEEWKQQKRKLELEERWFQLSLFKRLPKQERIDMQCRYVLSKRSLLRALQSSEIEAPLIDCDLRWAMQITEMFYNSLEKRAAEIENDEEARVAKEHLEELRNLKQEADNYLTKNSFSISEDFLFKSYKKKGKEYTSDLRSMLEEVMKQDQIKGLNQPFNNSNKYQFVQKLKIAYFIPMEKKLQDIVGCITKLRSLPHRQSFRSFEKFHRYNFRELEMLAFPELYATGQGFQQYLAPKIEKSNIVIEIQEQERKKAQDQMRNLKQSKKEMKEREQLQQQEEYERSQMVSNQLQNALSNKFKFSASLEDFTTQYRKGQMVPLPKQAILSLNQENYIRSSLSSAYMYDMQKISVIKVFQEAQESQSIAERSFNLEQDIEIKISGDEVLSESLKQEHVLKNFKDLLKKQQHWSNECQAFVKNLNEEVRYKRKYNNEHKGGGGGGGVEVELDNELLDYMRLQEKLFLERKREELSQQFKNIDFSDLEVLRQNHKIDLRRVQLQSISKQEGGQISEERRSSYQDALEELHSEVLQQITPLDEMTKQIQKKAATFSKQYTSIGEDTKFRLLNKRTRIFNSRHSFIFWRYTQRMLSRIFSYYAVVNGINFFEKQNDKLKQKQVETQQPIIKEFENLPPIKGSKMYFKQKYKEQRAISFQKGTPFLFLTYTLHEFDKKTFQVVRGLNNFDLENELLLKNRQKNMDKRTYISLTKAFAIYFHYMSKMVTRCIMNSNVKFKVDSHVYKLYDYGMFGPCVGYTNRFEFQQRGSVHLHQLLYFTKDQKGEISEKLLEYWASLFSLWNLTNKNELRRNKDREFIKEFQLNHICDSNCIKQEDGSCRKGYPWKLSTKPFWKRDYLNKIYPRVQNEEERTIFMHDRDLVKCFNSCCIIEACGNDKIIDYITKYISKVSKVREEEREQESEGQGAKESTLKSNDLENEQQGNEQQEKEQKENENEGKNNLNEKDITLRKQANDLVQRVISKKITLLQEAYCDLLDYPLFKTSFNCFKIAQVPLSEQFKINVTTLKQCYDADNPDQDLQISIKSSIWLKYLSRPIELEELTLYQYALNYLWYGNKKRYQDKVKDKKNEFFYVDLNGQIIKKREKQLDVILNLSQVYYLEELSYEPNLFYLAMLQLFWVHRQDSWLKETTDSYEGFQQHYYRLYNQSSSRHQTQQENEEQILEVRLDERKQTFKEWVDQYKKLTPAQQKFLKQVQFTPKQKQKPKEREDYEKCKQFFTYHSLLRAKNSIIKLRGLLEQESQSQVGFIQEIPKVMNFLRPDILINSFQKEEVLQLESSIIKYLEDHNWKNLSAASQTILQEFSSLLKSSGFQRLSSRIYQTHKRSQEITPEKEKEKDKQVEEEMLEQGHQRASNMFEKFAQSTQSKISQREINLFSNLNDENIEFPQHFRTVLTRSEFKNLFRPKIEAEFWEKFEPSEELTNIYVKELNQQQQLSILIQLHYFYQSQVQQQAKIRGSRSEEQRNENGKIEEEGAIYEGCLIHGGGGVGKSYIINFMIQLYIQLDVQYYILCPTQVAVQNLMKGKHDYSRIMTIHSFFNLNQNSSIDTCYDNFLSFLKYVNKEHLFQSSTAPLYPELPFYNCMMKVDKFTEKLKGVRVIMLEEISMIAPKFLSLLDIYLQISLSCNLPFGGVQIFGFGDSFQLQPVTHPPTYFFQSHVFQSNYFSTCLELTIPVRQAGDLEFYEKILQPIRVGEFQSHQNYWSSLRLLSMRHLDDKINNDTQFNLAQGLQEQVQRLQVDNKITFLYFENEEVTKENQIRAEQHIRAYQLQYQNQQQEQFRTFINSPSKLSFGVKSMKFDQLLINLSQDYEIFQEMMNQNTYSLSYAQHFKLLPLTIKNYLFQSLLPYVYERAKQTQKTAQSFPQYIKLFKTAQIVFRKNLNKAQRLINGQAAIIKDLQFEVDYKSEQMLGKQAIQKKEKIESYLNKGLIRRKEEQEDYFKIELSEQMREFAKRELEEEGLDNINTLFNEDVLESDKLEFLKCGIQPRLKALRIQIQGENDSILMENLEQYYQNITINIQTDKIKGIIKQASQLISLINSKIKQTDGSSEQIRGAVESFILGNKNAMKLFGISALQNCLDSHLLRRAEYHLNQLNLNLSDEFTPIQISQMPINLAYARTIHTSQGATFDNICVKLNSCHLSHPGLLYTAFSRVRNLSQLYLQGEFNEDIFRGNVPKELKRFFDQNFMRAQDILDSNFFSELIVKNDVNLKGAIVKIQEMNPIFRKELLQLLRRCGVEK